MPCPNAFVTYLQCVRLLVDHFRTCGYLTIDPPGQLPGHTGVPRNLAHLDTHTILLPSLDEIHQYFGPDTTPETAARHFHDLGAHTVVIKQGHDGATIFQSTKQPIHIPIFPTQVTDVTGAGDAFCGGFLVGLEETGDIVEAARYGAVTASLIIERQDPPDALNINRSTALTRLHALEQT